MKVELIPSTVGDPAARQFCIAAIINDSIALDAGTLGLMWPLERQRRIEHVFLSHSHIDHIATLPLLLDNIYKPGPESVTVYASQETQCCLREDVFNDRLWPDFIRLSDQESPFLKLITIESEVPIRLPSVTILPVAVDHIVPTLGFIVQSAAASVAFVTDTRPTKRIWELVNQVENLKAVFLETSFPNSHRWLAEKAGHLCSDDFEQELKKLERDVTVFAYHLKPIHFDEISRELFATSRASVRLAVPGQTYYFV